VDAFVAMTPAGRLATAHEVAAVVGFLASSQAAYVTGSEIAVDGGLTAAGIMRRILDDAGRARPGDHPGLRY
jgi:NAD(P)-dependent dehydrogenase (short-subunit alcohol dehydrogenase family)